MCIVYTPAISVWHELCVSNQLCIEPNSPALNVVHSMYLIFSVSLAVADFCSVLFQKLLFSRAHKRDRHMCDHMTNRLFDSFFFCFFMRRKWILWVFYSETKVRYCFEPTHRNNIAYNINRIRLWAIQHTAQRNWHSASIGFLGAFGWWRALCESTRALTLSTYCNFDKVNVCAVCVRVEIRLSLVM